MKKLVTGILFTSLFLVGCGSNLNPNSSKGPYWVSYQPLNSKPLIYYKLTKEIINKQKLSYFLTLMGEGIREPAGPIGTWSTNINWKKYKIEVFAIDGIDRNKEVAVKISNEPYYKAIVQNKKP